MNNDHLERGEQRTKQAEASTQSEEISTYHLQQLKKQPIYLFPDLLWSTYKKQWKAWKTQNMWCLFWLITETDQVYQTLFKTWNGHLFKDARSVYLYPYNRSQSFQYVKYTK